MTTQSEDWTVRPWEEPDQRFCLSPVLYDAMLTYLDQWAPTAPALKNLLAANITAIEILDEHTSAVYTDVVDTSRSGWRTELLVRGDGQCPAHLSFLTRRTVTNVPMPPAFLQVLAHKQK